MRFPKGKNRRTGLFCSLCCLVYFTSYITRINYAASIAEITVSLGLAKTLASMAITGSFITYGAGQLLNGVIGDRIKPRVMIFLGLFATAACNLFLSSLSNIYFITAVWCVNGFAQSMLWPPLTRIMAENLSAAQYRKTCVAVSVSASVATIAIYLIVPLCIVLSGWRAVFIVSAVLGLAVGFLWLFSINRLLSKVSLIHEETGVKSEVSPVNIRTLLFHSGLIPIMLIILLQGALRDGITTWMPSYINDIFHFGTSLSILNAAILPVFAIVSVLAASFVYKLVKDEMKASALFWSFGFLCSFVLLFVFSSQVILSTLMMAVVTGCMHGINLMLISVLPARYKGTGRVSTVSGLLNAFTYGGSAISSYGIAALSESFGWNITVITWCIVALCGTVISLVYIKKRKLPQYMQV